MALFRCGQYADGFKKWVIIAADGNSADTISYTYQNAEADTPTHSANATAFPFNDSDVISYSVSGTNATVTAKIDCVVYANARNNAASELHLTVGQTATVEIYRMAIFAQAK